MDTKIQELTEKLYNEGVEKGQAEAIQIVEKAKAEKETMLNNARAESKNIIAEAHKNAAEIKKNIESELQLYASQAVEALKTEITNLLTDKITHISAHTALNDKDFMQKLIMKLVSEWPKNEQMTIETADADALQKHFEEYAKDLLSNGLEIKQVNGKTTSFSIAPADGSYKVNFGEKEFEDYFKTFLRPQLIELLF